MIYLRAYCARLRHTCQWVMGCNNIIWLGNSLTILYHEKSHFDFQNPVPLKHRWKHFYGTSRYVLWLNFHGNAFKEKWLLRDVSMRYQKNTKNLRNSFNLPSISSLKMNFSCHICEYMCENDVHCPGNWAHKKKFLLNCNNFQSKKQLFPSAP